MDISPSLPQEISHWIETNVTRPIAGFEQKKRANGNSYNHEEQLKATHHQLKLIAHYYMQKGISQEEILGRLSSFS